MYNELIELVSEVDKYKEFVNTHELSLEEIQAKMSTFYHAFKNIAPLYYDEEKGDFSKNYTNAISRLNSLELLYLPNIYIIPIEVGFVDTEDLIAYIVKYAYKMLLKEHDPKTFDFSGKCVDAYYEVYKICQRLNVPCQTIKIVPMFDYYLLDNPISTDCVGHYASIVTLNNVEYLVDITYCQFFKVSRNNIDRLGVPYLSSCNPGYFMLNDESRMKTAENLLEKGYVKATEENLKNYFDGFAISFRNGLYYEKNGNDFSTNYSVKDYFRFIFYYVGSQALEEKIENLGRLQRIIK